MFIRGPLADLTKLCNSVAELSSFAHLERLEDGATKAAQAKAAVAQLRTMVTPHQQATEDARASIRRQQLAAERNAASASVQAKLADFLRRYQQLVTSQDAQARGYELERLMYEIFRLFDLDPKASFKSRGEQVDGGFSFDGIDYLFEGKWVSGLVALADLDIFRGKLARKLDNTLGLFLSINGFAPAALEARSATREVLLLMDGEDLLAVLESRIGFRDLIMRKRRHAAQTGVTFLSVREMLTA